MKATLCAVLLLTSLHCVAQASVRGKIMEPQGAAANAKIVFTNVATHRKAKDKTTPDGTFGPVQLPPGAYKVEVRKHCFKKYSKELTLSESRLLWLSIGLEQICGPPPIAE